MKLEAVKTLNNFILIKSDATYTEVEIAGGMKLAIGYNHEDRGKHLAIGGTVLKLPDEMTYHGYTLKKNRNMGTRDLSDDEARSMVSTSLEWDTEMELQLGDRLIFDYFQQIACDEEGRIVDVEGYGDCLLIPYGSVFGYIREDDTVHPVNGYLFFKRDQIPETEMRDSGIELVHFVKHYDLNWGEIVRSSPPVKDLLNHLNGEPDEDIKDGSRVYVKPGHGFKIAYDLHAGDYLKNIEVIRRPHILALCS